MVPKVLFRDGEHHRTLYYDCASDQHAELVYPLPALMLPGFVGFFGECAAHASRRHARLFMLRRRGMIRG